MNEFLSHRVAKASFTLTNGSAASSLKSGVIIPKGALVTGVRINAPSAITIAAASGTALIAAGGLNLVVTSNISALVAAVTVPKIPAITATGGLYMTAAGELLFVEGASNNAAATATYDVYVDYIYA